MVDCRWSIKVDEGSKVRIFFASFQTEDRYDFAYVTKQLKNYNKIVTNT